MDATLSYAPAEPICRRKRIIRGAIAFCVVFFLGFAGWKFYPELMRRFSMLYYQRRVMNTQTPLAEAYSFIPTPLDKNGGPQSTFLSGGGASMIGADDDWTHFRDACQSPVPPMDCPIYIHTISDRHGNASIIAVQIVSSFGGADSPRLTVDVIKPGTLFEYPSVAPVVARPFQFDNNSEGSAYPQFTFKIFTGQPDPADPSHFTIDYDLNGQRHTLDGYINEQDVLTMEKRKESSTNPS
jgi:hypothetical protein